MVVPSNTLFLVFFSLLLFIFITFFLYNLNADFDGRRIFVNFKLLPFLLPFVGAYGGFQISKINSKSIFTLFSFIFLLPLFSFAFFEGSRQSFAGVVGYSLAFCFYSAFRYRFKILSCFFFFFLVFACFVVGRESNASTLLIDLLPLFSNKFMQFFQYPTGYSFGNFSRQLLQVNTYDYNFLSFVLNLNPLPSSFVPNSDYTPFSDSFSPVGASVLLFQISPILLFIYWTYYGFLTRRVVLRTSGLLKIFCFLLLALLFLLSFQYSVRACARVSSFILILTFLPRIRLSGGVFRL
ncbi:hypothetical protein OAA55_00420 [bacterium]|nr:hypothetical protein [bacterium]